MPSLATPPKTGVESPAMRGPQLRVPTVQAALADPLRVEILRELSRRRAEYLWPPTWAELGKIVADRQGFSEGTSPTNIKGHVLILARFGLVRHDRGKMRTLVITKEGDRRLRRIVKS